MTAQNKSAMKDELESAAFESALATHIHHAATDKNFAWRMFKEGYSFARQQLEQRDSQVIAEFVRRMIRRIEPSGKYHGGNIIHEMNTVAAEMAAPSKEVCE